MFVIAAKTYIGRRLYYYVDWATGNGEWTPNLKQAMFFDKPAEALAVLEGSEFTGRMVQKEATTGPSIMVGKALQKVPPGERGWVELGVFKVDIAPLVFNPPRRYYATRGSYGLKQPSGPRKQKQEVK